jgi:hypothetical protein
MTNQEAADVLMGLPPNERIYKQLRRVVRGLDECLDPDNSNDIRVNFTVQRSFDRDSATLQFEVSSALYLKWLAQE